MILIETVLLNIVRDGTAEYQMPVIMQANIYIKVFPKKIVKRKKLQEQGCTTLLELEICQNALDCPFRRRPT